MDGYKMGVTPSCRDAMIRQFIHFPGSNIARADIFLLPELDDRVVVLLGEEHKHNTPENVGVYAFLDSICEVPEANVDFFVELDIHLGSQMYENVPGVETRGQQRKRGRISAKEWPTTRAQLEKDKEYTIDQLRVYFLQRGCTGFRAHAVDPRNYGFANYYIDVSHTVRDLLPSTVLASLDRSWADSVAHEFRYVKLLTEQLLPSVPHAFAGAVQNELSRLQQEIDRLNPPYPVGADVPVWDRRTASDVPNPGTQKYLNMLFVHQAKYLDVYTLAKMVQEDNKNITIFYGGSSHTRRLAQLFKKITGAEHKYTHDTRHIPYVEEGRRRPWSGEEGRSRPWSGQPRLWEGRRPIRPCGPWGDDLSSRQKMREQEEKDRRLAAQAEERQARLKKRRRIN